MKVERNNERVSEAGFRFSVVTPAKLASFPTWLMLKREKNEGETRRELITT